MSTCGSSCGCAGGGTGLPRRDFLKAVAIAGAAFCGPRTGAAAPALVLVPPDKRLDPAWVRSLVERGVPTVVRAAEELRHVGMPVGGLCAGQVYLGGDGRLWHWDVFNAHLRTGAEHYAKPMAPAAPFAVGFALRTSAAGVPPRTRTLDAAGFREVAFRGEYPVGRVEYRDSDCPVEACLEAYSPFVPLQTDDSSLPATVMEFAVRNTGRAAVTVDLVGRLENAVHLNTAADYRAVRANRIVREDGLLMLECSATPPAAPDATPAAARPPIVFADFEGGTYGEWKVEGEALGSAPSSGSVGVQTLSGQQGRGLINTWTGSDKPQGRALSPEFIIDRKFINFLYGGGQHNGETCINLLVDGKAVRTQTGRNTDEMIWASWSVADLDGKCARIEAVDRHSGGWGHIDLDQIEFADAPRTPARVPFEQAPDHGTMALALAGAGPSDRGTAQLSTEANAAGYDPSDGVASASTSTGPGPTGALASTFVLKPGEARTATFILAWHFPNLVLDPKLGEQGRYYATKHASAPAVARYVARERDRLGKLTRLWRDTWYDSTLPYWFLDRAFANASILATSTCHRFRTGRFYGWEGVGCCAGTCTHVWHYAHSAARLFPDLERALREITDFGIAFHPETGSIRFRGECNAGPAVDGQAGVVLRTLREHQMSADDAFLKRVWPRARKALEFLIGLDGDGDGIIAAAQHNTLDADWHGPVAWLSGLYLAALRAGEEMARETGDTAFADRCRAIFEAGRKNLVAQLWGGEYFLNKPDPAHPEAINSGTGCHIDQVFGQSWAFQVGLGRVLPEKETRAALAALWRYNFATDVGPYREANKPGRWYAMPGEAGLLMCTFPRPDWDYRRAAGKGPEWAAGYFNECMNGFEHQAAGHMIWEGMVEQGLAVFRAVHDRYAAARRNPWNEVECGDHYARSMASHGVFLAACGFEYHGPKGRIGWAPRLTPEDFRAPFTAAEGWGTIAQRRAQGRQEQTLTLRHGRLRVAELVFELPEGAKLASASAKLGTADTPCRAAQDGTRVTVTLGAALTLEPGQALSVTLAT